jgi:hypothetical protein
VAPAAIAGARAVSEEESVQPALLIVLLVIDVAREAVLATLEARSLDRPEPAAVREHAPLLAGEPCLLSLEPGRLPPSQLPAAYSLGDARLLANLPLADAPRGFRWR